MILCLAIHIQKTDENEDVDQSKTNHESRSNGGQNGKEENLSVKSLLPAPEHHEAAPDRYPDVLDIAGMDYSPARRKSPIHN